MIGSTLNSRCLTAIAGIPSHFIGIVATSSPPSSQFCGGPAPRRLSDHDSDVLFARGKPTVFAFQCYRWLIDRRTNHKNLHVRGYKEKGTTTTPFVMCVFDGADRFHLVQDVIGCLPQLGSRAGYAKPAIANALIEHRKYVNHRGEDHPFVLGWIWGEKTPARVTGSSTEAENV
jgi:xylulose-5-phosphate/fructose-6-phosphate phosphoketolase